MVCATALLTTGCATFPSSFNAMGNLPGSAVVLNVPYERQSNEYLCGLAAADMVLQYYKTPMGAEQHQLLQQTARNNGGLTGRILRTAFANAGFSALVFQGTLDHGVAGIFHHLDQRRPLIVMYAPRAGVAGHYVVVVGYDPVRDVVLVLDPGRGHQVVRRTAFLHLWQPSGYFTLLVVPRPQATGQTTHHKFHNAVT